MSEREVFLFILLLQPDPLFQASNPSLDARHKRPGAVKAAEQGSNLADIVPVLLLASSSDQHRLKVTDKLLTVRQL